MYPRNPGLFDNVPNSENLRNFANYEPDSKVLMNFAGYYDGYPPIYPPRMGFDYTPDYLENYDYEATEEFPSLLNNNPPGFTSDEYYPPPGFAKPVKTKAPNPNAVSFIPSFLATTPIKDEKEEQDSKDFGVRGILALQKNLSDDKSSLAKGKDLTIYEGHKNTLENYSTSLNSVFEPNLDSNLQADFSLPSSYYVSKQVFKAKMLKMYHIETLFYIFYNLPGEIIQEYSAKELYRRDWAYDPKKQRWFSNTLGEWKTFDLNKFEIVNTQPSPGPFLNKDEVLIKQQPLA